MKQVLSQLLPASPAKIRQKNERQVWWILISFHMFSCIDTPEKSHFGFKLFEPQSIQTMSHPNKENIFQISLRWLILPAIDLGKGHNISLT
jgi:hypothetical protein